MGRAAMRHGVTVERRPREEIDSVDDHPVDAGLLEQERRAHLHEAVDALPPRLRYGITSCYFDERTVKDLAAEFGVRGSRVSKLHSKALSHLRNMLQDA
jgi:RNA polymerase sigma factor for flagellar operon FliA